MKPRYFVRPAIEADLRQAAEWLERVSARERFSEEVFRVFDFLAQFPDAGTPVRTKQSRFRAFRFLPLGHPFQNFLVFYHQPTSRGPEMVRVIYGTQNWRHQLDKFLG
jgi:plasmid stabilization system protein ParE